MPERTDAKRNDASGVQTHSSKHMDKKGKKIVKATKEKTMSETKKIIDLPGKKQTDAKKESRLKIPGIKRAKKAESAAKGINKVKKFTDDPYTVLHHVVMTEKAVRMVEAQNKLVFIVGKKFDKLQIKQAATTAFNAEILKVNTVLDQRGRKKAYIRFAKPGQAGDIAIRLGII